MENFARNFQRLFCHAAPNLVAVRGRIGKSDGGEGRDAARILVPGWAREQAIFSRAAIRQVKRRRTEITVEIDEVIHAVNHRRWLIRAWCPACGSVAHMLTPEQAAAMARVTVRAVNRRVEDGSVHFLETADGRLLVCVNSLD